MLRNVLIACLLAGIAGTAWAAADESRQQEAKQAKNREKNQQVADGMTVMGRTAVWQEHQRQNQNGSNSPSYNNDACCT